MTPEENCERGALIMRKYGDDGLSPEEEARLEYLNSLMDAKLAPTLARRFRDIGELEASLNNYLDIKPRLETKG